MLQNRPARSLAPRNVDHEHLKKQPRDASIEPWRAQKASIMKKLFLLDGMALVYRAHFALIARPIYTSKGVNTSALYGFTQTVLEILKNQKPTHLAVVFDTDKPTQRHIDYPQYKATREAMPEDLSKALPHVERMLEALRIPSISCDGYEADDLIGTLVRRAEQQGFISYMVTPDKDFGQLVTENTFLYKPARMGDAVEVLGVPEICQRWEITSPRQVIDMLALIGDTSDNIPGVPGVGEKTAAKLLGHFGSVEGLVARVGEVPGKLGERLRTHKADAELSKKLATIICDAPCEVDLDSLQVRDWDEPTLKALFVEFEFNSIGRRLFGDEFRAGRGASAELAPKATPNQRPNDALELPSASSAAPPEAAAGGGAKLARLADVPHTYCVIAGAAERKTLLADLRKAQRFAMKVLPEPGTRRDPKLLGIAFAMQPGIAWQVRLPRDAAAAKEVLLEIAGVLQDESIEKVGFNLKTDVALLRWHDVRVRGRLFDCAVAHALVEPELRHTVQQLAEMYFGYTPMDPDPEPKAVQVDFLAPPDERPDTKSADRACEFCDLALQLRPRLAELLTSRGQERVFYEIESPLIHALVEMEYEGIRVDAEMLGKFATQLAREMDEHERTIYHLAGGEFNLNSPRQLGQVLFENLKLKSDAKKTKTGQYVTDEQTLAALADEHEVVRRLLEYRGASKLKSTYADALPGYVWPTTGRIHTTYNQVMTATGRLSSHDPNLQNIPIRTDKGQEIRKAFVPRNPEYLLLSADYSQIELRIIAALSEEPGLLEAFRTNTDVHTATAAKVFGVALDGVTPEMRRKAKMVNYGIAYGISAFGLAQRLGIARKEAGDIINQYFAQFAGIAGYMERTINFAREHGYVETVTGRRRYIRDIRSSNATVRGGAERNAINAPIQGTAADMIKLAMIAITDAIRARNLRSRMLLQVHDELVFDLHRSEEAELRKLVVEKMVSAIPLAVPIEVEVGAGENWLEAH